MDWINSLQQYTKEDWLREIRKDNPKTFEDILEHQVIDQISGLSFATKEDIVHIPEYKSSNMVDQQWLIGISIKYNNSYNTKELMNICLNNGVEHLIIECESEIKIEELDYLLQDVYTDLLKVEFRFNNINISHDFIQYFSQKNCLYSYMNSNSKINPSTSITQIYNFDIHNFENINLSTLIKSHTSRITLNLGKDFLYNISFVRGLKKALQQLNSEIAIENAISIENSLSRNNMIDYSIIALSAVIDKPDSLIIKHHDNYKLDKEQTHQVYKQYLQLQHILKAESFLNKNIDPIKGSYYIEDLSHKIYLKLIS